MPYKDAPKPVSAIARELQVDAVIEGSVARDGGKVQITTTMIRGATGAVIWAQKFERDANDVLTLQREVVGTITSKVDITMRRASRRESRAPVRLTRSETLKCSWAVIMPPRPPRKACGGRCSISMPP